MNYDKTPSPPTPLVNVAAAKVTNSPGRRSFSKGDKPQTPAVAEGLPQARPNLSLYWFRRDLRLNDNAALYYALTSGNPVLPVFIFDKNILDELDDRNDRRVSFIHKTVEHLQMQLENIGSSLDVRYGNPLEIFRQLIKEYRIDTAFTNHDYEPYAIQRDEEIKKFLEANGIGFKTFKDQVIFEKNEIVKDNHEPYSVFTPYSKKWLASLHAQPLKFFDTTTVQINFFKCFPQRLLTLNEIGFIRSPVDDIPFIDEKIISSYHQTRDIPSLNTSKLGVHLRFGTISIRQLVKKALELNSVFLNELIWREFFMQALWHQPRLVHESFKKEYENINWRNDEEEFERWSNGQTGYPLVDAGMRELNATGFMHNRIRMVTASFLVKHLLVDWKWGEAFFAKKLMDYELASNNGNWQWVAGCGCDAAPYFRIFNPTTQAKKFDPSLHYINKWIPELNDFNYAKPLVEHNFARERCLKTYKAALNFSSA